MRDAINQLPGKKQVYAALRVFHPPKQVYRRLRFEGDFSVRVDEQASFRVYSQGRAVENQLFWQGLAGYEEAASLRLWIRLCREASVIFDIGANIGLYSLIAAAVNPAAQIYGFEPYPLVYEAFQRNCEINRFHHLKHLPLAVSSANGVAALFYHSNKLDTASLQSDGRALQTSVPVTTLAHFIGGANLKQVDLLKIDVETLEPQVLEGMGDYLSRLRPAMIVEVLNDQIGARLAQLLPRDYLFFHIDEKLGPRRRERIERISRCSRNYLFCSEALARRLDLRADQ